MKKFLLFFCIFMLTAVNVCAWETPRWGYFPLNVYIEDHPKKTIVIKALSNWENRTNGTVKFKIKTSAYNAPLVIKFSSTDKDIQKGEFENAVGLASTVDPWGFYTKAVITIFLENPSSGKTLSDSQIYGISLHEIGHALGLKHTTNPNDIMYPQEHGITTLSENDLNNLDKIYKPD